jgi:hypothetical protein
MLLHCSHVRFDQRAPMEDASFQHGDRVRARFSMFYIRAGMVGTILAVAEPTRTVCIVQFDDLPGLELISVHLLERLEPQSPG